MKSKRYRYMFQYMALLLVASLWLTGCKRTVLVEYYATADWVFINNSSYNVTIKDIRQYEYDDGANMKISTGSRETVRFGYDSGEDVQSNFYPLPFYDNCIVSVNDIDCIVSEGCFIRNMNNYTITKLGTNHFQFTYTFTDKNTKEMIQ